MTHLDEEQLQRLLDAELEGSAEAAARAHVADCAECRARAAETGREADEVDRLLRSLDLPPPLLDVGAIAARAQRSRVAWRRAAGILILLGAAGVAYAIPGSPLPDWATAVRDWATGSGRSPAAADEAWQAPDPGVAGIAVRPGADLLILFPSSAAGSRARVSLTDGDQVVVQAPPAAATYTSDVSRLVIDHRGPPVVFDIAIPRSAPRVEIRVGDRRLLLKDRSRIVTDAAGEVAGSYLLPLVPPAR